MLLFSTKNDHKFLRPARARSSVPTVGVICAGGAARLVAIVVLGLSFGLPTRLVIEEHNHGQGQLISHRDAARYFGNVQHQPACLDAQVRRLAPHDAGFRPALW